MIDILSENGEEKYGIKEYTVDTPSELSNLPTNIKMGSTCFVISTSEKYMLNSNGEWIKIIESEGGGSGLPGSLTVSVNSAGVVRAESNGNVEIHQLSSSDDADFVASNIKKNVTIFGITGSYDIPTPTITINNGTITASAGNKQTTHTLSSTDDGDFIASNIRENTEIFGITGTLVPMVAPEIGFVPTVWNESGYITEGKWYGTEIPNLCFRNSSSNESGPYTKLQSVQFIDNVTQIGAYAFAGCANLLLSELPETLSSSIGNNTFYQCAKITIDEIPSGVQNIYNHAFNGCLAITSITFKGTPSSIAVNAFLNCDNLTDIYVPWALNVVSDAPWGAPNATIHYNYTSEIT